MPCRMAMQLAAALMAFAQVHSFVKVPAPLGRSHISSNPFSQQMDRAAADPAVSGGQPDETRVSKYKELQENIARFYDESSAIWEQMWGEHMHHGFYATGREKDHQQAQRQMVDEALKFAGVATVRHSVDVGCGIGGSSRHIARKYGAKVQGITLSPFQKNRAVDLTQKADLSNQVTFQTANALQMPFADNSMDLVWSMESGEHMPDKAQFIQEMARVAAPGGKIVVVTWCHRDLRPGESLTRIERGLLKLINRIYHLPPWVSIQDYIGLAKRVRLENVRAADWTEQVKPFWPAVLRSSLSLRALKVLATSSTVRRGAIAILYMIVGYKIGLIRFGVITGQKAAAESSE